MTFQLEDVALPVEPGVHLDVARVPLDLHAHLGVLREIGLAVPHGLDEPVVLSAVEVAQDDVDAFELRLQPDPGQQVKSALILVALPHPDVVIGVVGIFVGAVEAESMHAELDVYLVDRVVGQTG